MTTESINCPAIDRKAMRLFLATMTVPHDRRALAQRRRMLLYRKYLWIVLDKHGWPPF